MIGSLLRLPHEVVEARILATLNGDAFDISAAELGVFLYPAPMVAARSIWPDSAT
jgi:hypothetical protein